MNEPLSHHKLLGASLHVLQVISKDKFHCSKEFDLKVPNGNDLKNFLPTAVEIGKLTARDGFIGKTKEEQACVYQWLEHLALHLNCKETERFLELNVYLKDKVYFVGNRLTIVDVLLYMDLHWFYKRMSFQEKESYQHLSRWFRQVQNDCSAYNIFPKVIFSKTRLYT